MLVALIDDVILYKAVCSAVQKEWHYITPDESMVVPVDSYREGQQYIKDMQGGELVSKDIDRGFKSCVFALNQILGRIKRDTNCDDYIVLLSSRERSSFRYNIAKIKPYKGHRPPKPKYYDEMYDHIVYNHPCLISRKSREVDDELGIIQTSGKHPHTHKEVQTIICTSDKDLLQIPGLQYGLDNKKVFNVDRTGKLVLLQKNKQLQIKGTGLKWFYAQMLLGDSADNIPGIPAKQIPGEAKLVAQRIYDGLNGTLEQAERFVYQCYQNQYNDQALTAMTEVGRLLYMLTCEDKELWSPKYVG